MTIVTSAARLSAAAMLFALPAAGQAAVVLTAASYSENFNSLASSGTGTTTNGVLANGWQFVETGSNANTTYAAGDGTSNAGNTYSFGTTGSTDRAFGALASGSLESTIGVVFTNNTGSTITALDVNFFNEQWRNGSTTAASSFAFSYLVGATSLGGTGWTSVAALNLVDLVATANANGAATNGNTVRQLREGEITGLNIAQGQSIGFRWIDLDDTGSDDALAIDDFNLTATLASTTPAVPEPATWAMMIAGFGLVGGAMRRRNSTLVSA